MLGMSGDLPWCAEQGNLQVWGYNLVTGLGKPASILMYSPTKAGLVVSRAFPAQTAKVGPVAIAAVAAVHVQLHPSPWSWLQSAGGSLHGVVLGL